MVSNESMYMPGSVVVRSLYHSDVESDRDSVCSVEWDDEHGITTLRRYYALRDEAQVTVDESKRAWVDTPFSVFALQSEQYHMTSTCYY